MRKIGLHEYSVRTFVLKSEALKLLLGWLLVSSNTQRLLSLSVSDASFQAENSPNAPKIVSANLP